MRYLVMPIAVALLAFCIVFSISRNLNNSWTSIRLAPAFALAHGYPMYCLPDHPPWVMAGYGPFYPVAYLPCIFAKDPVTAVSAATILAFAYILIPVGLLSRLYCRRLTSSPDGVRVGWLPMVLFFGLLTNAAPSLAYIATAVHVDAPALGLFLMACYGVLCAGEVNRMTSGRLVALAGIAAGFSVSCKFTLMAGVFALSLFALWSLDGKRAAGFTLSTVLTLSVIYTWIGARDGFAAVFLNLQVFGRIPWVKYVSIGVATLQDTSTQVSEKALTSLFLGRAYLINYGAVIVATLVLIRPPSRQASPQGTPLASQLVWLFLFVALMVMPVSIASVAKYGGGDNSRGLFTLPLTLAAVFALWATVQRADLSGNLAACAALTGVTLIVALSVKGEIKRLSFGRSIMEESYATIRAHPSQCYFPYDPLAHLLAGDRCRPNMDAVYTYAIGGFPVSKAAFESSLPQGFAFVVVPPFMKFWGLGELHRLLPAQNAPTSVLHLAYHEAWVR